MFTFWHKKRDEKKESQEKYKKGWAKAALTIHLVDESPVEYEIKHYNDFQDIGDFTGKCVEWRASEKLRYYLPITYREICRNGIKIGKTFYSPHFIKKVTLGEIVEGTD